MSGKSTLLRQTCIAIIMAQLGCFVPAQSCRMTIFDRIFTRIGANDNILSGQSTFMVELSETNKILQGATPKSLVILDELGRGTSTFDGYAIAYAVLAHLSQSTRCCGLFSTHYGLLTSEFSPPLCPTPTVRLMHMACQVDENQRDVTFLYRLIDGVCPRSYGMNVAGMAGIPEPIIARAEEKGREMEDFKGWIGCVGRMKGDEEQNVRVSRSIMAQKDFQTVVNVCEEKCDVDMASLRLLLKVARARYL